MSEDRGQPWYDAAFGEGYAAVYGHRDLDEARRDLALLLELGLSAPLLDLGCGGGRHLVAAREHGLWGVGVDRSRAQLLGASGLGLPLARGDFRALPLASGSLASALSLFSSFGYLDEAGDLQQLRELARVLRAGGELFLDLPDRGRVRQGLVPRSVRDVRGGRVHERRWLAHGGRRVRKEVRLERPGAEPLGWTEDLALYAPAEVRALLLQAGFSSVDRWDPASGGRLGLRARR